MITSIMKIFSIQYFSFYSIKFFNDKNIYIFWWNIKIFSCKLHLFKSLQDLHIENKYIVKRRMFFFSVYIIQMNYINIK